MKDIPQDWIKRYVDQLLDVAKQLPDGSRMKDAALLRADHVMDLVKAWRESEGAK